MMVSKGRIIPNRINFVDLTRDVQTVWGEGDNLQGGAKKRIDQLIRQMYVNCIVLNNKKLVFLQKHK